MKKNYLLGLLFGIAFAIIFCFIFIDLLGCAGIGFGLCFGVSLGLIFGVALKEAEKEEKSQNNHDK